MLQAGATGMKMEEEDICRCMLKVDTRNNVGALACLCAQTVLLYRTYHIIDCRRLDCCNKFVLL
jgi:hypothetical protein